MRKARLSDGKLTANDHPIYLPEYSLLKSNGIKLAGRTLYENVAARQTPLFFTELIGVDNCIRIYCGPIIKILILSQS
jgi:hypothetical protein